MKIRARKCVSLLGFWNRSEGLAAIEFAIIVPVLATIVVMIWQVSMIEIGALHMEGAVRAASQYAMNGGGDLTAAQAAGNRAWINPPQNATLSVSNMCLCGNQAGLCDQVCADGNLPQSYVSVAASDQLGTSYLNIQKSMVQNVRTR